MPDEIIEELWKVKDDMAREYGNDVRKLAAYLEGRRASESDESLKRHRIPDSPR